MIYIRYTYYIIPINNIAVTARIRKTCFYYIYLILLLEYHARVKNAIDNTYKN